MTKEERLQTRPLSRHQVATLRYLSQGVSIDHLGLAHQGTLWSLLHRKYCARVNGSLTLSPAGVEVVNAYDAAAWRERKVEGPVTDRVSTLLRYARALRK